MVWLILFLILDLALVAHFEKKEEQEYSLEIDTLIRDAKYHEAHPEMKRSVKYMKAGYFGN